MLCRVSNGKRTFYSFFLAEEEAAIVGTYESSVWSGGIISYPAASKLIDGLGLLAWGDGCAHTNDLNSWFSLELDMPKIVTRVQIADRWKCCSTGASCCERSQNVRITIGPSQAYDPSEPLCLPEIAQLVQQAGLQDYPCTVLHEGKFVKISRSGVLNMCEIKVFALQGK